MHYRFFFSLLLVFGLTTFLPAQAGNKPCAELAKSHLSKLDKALDLDFKQMKCLQEVAERFCAANKATPPENAAQRSNRLTKFREALLGCLNAKQQEKVKNHFRDGDGQARRDILQAFVEEFGDEVIVIKKKS